MSKIQCFIGILKVLVFKVSAYQYFYLNTLMKLLEQSESHLSKGFYNYSDNEALRKVTPYKIQSRSQVS